MAAWAPDETPTASERIRAAREARSEVSHYVVRITGASTDWDGNPIRRMEACHTVSRDAVRYEDGRDAAAIALRREYEHREKYDLRQIVSPETFVEAIR